MPPEILSGERDEQLFGRFCEDADRVALAVLLERHVDTVAGACARLLPPALAEEAAQETFVQVIRSARGFKRGAKFKQWLLGIAVNSCRRAARQERQTVARERAVRNDPLTSGAATTADSDAVKGELLGALDACLREFSADERVALVLHYGHGLSQSEVAAILNRPRGTVGSWLSSGLNRLRAMLRGRGLDPNEQALALLMTTAPPALSTAALRAGALKSAATVKPLPAVLIKGTLTMKLALATTALAATAVLVAWGPRVLGADGAKPTAPALSAPVPKATTAIGTPDAELTAILNKKVTVNYHNQYLSGILLDLRIRTGLNGVFAPPVRREHVYTLILKDKTVREVLETVAAEGGLQLELRGHTVACWKNVPDNTIAEIEQRVHATELWQRIAAVQQLGKLGSRRACATLFKLLADPDEQIVREALTQLKAIGATSTIDGPRARILHLVEGADASVPALLKNVEYAKLKTGGYGSETRDRVGLICALDGPNARQFMRAYAKPGGYFCTLTALATINDECVEEQLQGLLKSGAAGRDRAMQLMMARGLPRDLEKLLEFLNGPDPVDSMAALRIMEADYSVDVTGDTVRDARILTAALKLVNSSDPQQRLLGADALCKSRDPEALKTAYTLLTDPENKVRYAVSMHAYNLPNLDSRTIERIAAMAANEIDENVRHPAAAGLRMINDDYAVQCLVGLLESPRAEVRRDTCDLFGAGYEYMTFRADDRTIVPALLKLIHDADRPTIVIDGRSVTYDDEVRWHALTALAQFPIPQVAGALKPLVLQPEEKLKQLEIDYFATISQYYRQYADYCLANIEYDGKGEGRMNARLRDAKCWGLAARAWVNAEPAAREVILNLPGEHPLLLQLLGDRSDEQVVQRLVAQTHSADVHIRRMATGALRDAVQRSPAQTPALLPVLTLLAADADPLVSEVAAGVVFSCAERDARVNPLAVAQAMPDSTAQKAALGIAKLGFPTVAKKLEALTGPATAVAGARNAGIPGMPAIQSPSDVAPETQKSRDALLSAAKDEARKKIRSGLEKALAKHPQVGPELQAMMRSSQVQEVWLKVIVDGAFSVCPRPMTDQAFAGACESIRRMRETGSGLEGDAFIDDYVSKSIEASIPAQPGTTGGKTPAPKHKAPIVDSSGVRQLP